MMNLLLGFPVQVQLPLDASGQPDFMDAWCVVLCAGMGRCFVCTLDTLPTSFGSMCKCCSASRLWLSPTYN